MKWKLKVPRFSCPWRLGAPASLLAGLVLVGATGCKHPETGALSPQSTAGFDAENKEKFVLLDKMVQYSVTASGLQDTILPDGRYQVKANIRNRENRRIQVQVDCQFKDIQGFVTEEMPFQTLILTENSQETVAFTSSNDKAKRYTIRVRQAR
jgi:hypothetical protein